MSFTAERLYALLPAIYRERDAAQGHPLRAIVSIMAEQLVVIEEDIDQLYDDLFIDTCADWVVPYLGALVGVSDAEASRAEVANTLAYRRRKGTAAVLEQLARDITAWPTSVVEYFSRLATTQYLNHLRPAHASVVDIRAPRWLGTPFDSWPRNLEVRSISSGRGRYNIPNIGLHLWRLRSLSLSDIPASRLDDRRWRFDPLGRDIPLFNRPQPEREISHLAGPENVPLPLRSRELHERPERYFGPGNSIEISIDGTPLEPAPGQEWSDLVRICNLMDHAGSWAHLPSSLIAIDPERGRIAFPQNATPTELQVTVHHGFAAEMGGGEYPRQESFDTTASPVRVPGDHTTIEDALNAVAEDGGAIQIDDSDTYTLNAAELRVPTGGRVELRAAEGRRPVLVLNGDLTVAGGENSLASLNGLVFTGGAIQVPESHGGDTNQLAELRISHCTLAPRGSDHDTVADPPPVRCQVEANCTLIGYRSIIGPVRSAQGAELQLADCLLDAGIDNDAFTSPSGDTGGVLDVQASTLIGRVHCLSLTAQDSIFLASASEPVRVDRLQQACVRFCYVPPGSRTPRRYRCVPADDAAQPLPVPDFTSLLWSDPGYAQLSARTPAAIRAGAENGGEMGVFHHLRQTQKIGRLLRSLPEHLRLSLEAGLFFES